MKPWTWSSELSYLCQTELESMDLSGDAACRGANILVGQMEWVGDGSISLSVTLRPIYAHVVVEYPEHLFRVPEVKVGV